jgi:cystathionine beta-lyase/cystathionine gamma-synthase
MYKKRDKEYSYETELLERGAYIDKLATNPETAPIYLTTAFNVENLEELEERYAVKGFCYNRNRNPNRSALIELMTYSEKGEDSVICPSGMSAISTTIMALVEQGDHIVSNRTLYGETIDFLTKILHKYGVEVTFVDFTKREQIIEAIRPNTKLVYTETISNPMITVVDLDDVALIAHRANALFVVDNTFVTSVGVRPIEHGADIVVNSLTKFANGHSDAVCGAATGTKELIKRIYEMQVLLGGTADAFTSWLVQRGMRTMALRVMRQADNALKLAEALEKDSHVLKVNYPGLASHPQHELAKKMMKYGYGGMMSIVLPDNRKKMNQFMSTLNIVHYAMTLGGYRTTLSHPVMSSHYDIPEEQRLKMGITDGLLRISVGIENPDDLIGDFLHALTVYDD